MPNETGNPSLVPSILETSLPDPFVSNLGEDLLPYLQIPRLNLDFSGKSFNYTGLKLGILFQHT